MPIRTFIFCLSLIYVSGAWACEDGQCPHNKKPQWSTSLGLQGVKAKQLDDLQQQFKAEHVALEKQQHDEQAAMHEQHQQRLSELLTDEQLQTVAALAHAHKHHALDKEHSKHRSHEKSSSHH